MSYLINETHGPALTSWVGAANDSQSDFPIQNLPFGVFRRKGALDASTVGIAIGNAILDVATAQAAGLYTDAGDSAAVACRNSALNPLMALGGAHWSALRLQTSRLLRADTPEGQRAQTVAERILVPMAEAELVKPVQIGDFTDFLTSVYHATNAGKIFNPDSTLGLNFKYLPLAYHGRASSIILSGTAIRRPNGQIKSPTDAVPSFAPTRRFDYELEVGFYIGQPNAWGEPIPIAQAEDHLFGLCLVNDWSARDIQGWEMQPLGPFLSKSTATTISPWVVTLEALAPFRRAAFARPAGDPAPLPHLYDEQNQKTGGLDVALEIHYSSQQMREQGIEPVRLSQTSLKHLYWTPAQLLAHHTSNGCNMQIGDLFASGTVSGPTQAARGCLLELTWGGKEPLILPTGEQRLFVEDQDEVIFTGYCTREGYRRIGLGACRGRIQ